MIKGGKQFGIYFAIVIVVGGLVWYFASNFQPETRIFTGKVTATNSHSVTVQLQAVGLGLNPIALEPTRVMTIRINSDTRIIKETGPYMMRINPLTKKMPASGNVSRAGQKVTSKELISDAAQQSVYVKITAKNSFILRGSFTAMYINYNLDNIAFSP